MAGIGGAADEYEVIKNVIPPRSRRHGVAERANLLNKPSAKTRAVWESVGITYTYYKYK